MESLLFSRLSQSGKAPAAQEAAGFKLSQVLCGLAFEAHLGRFPEDDLSIFLIRQDLQTVLFFYAEQSSHIDREDHSPQLVHSSDDPRGFYHRSSLLSQNWQLEFPVLE